MIYANLPKRSIVNRVVPKNAFDSYTNTKEKKLFTDVIEKIHWTNKLSADTINLPNHEIQEIQVFEIILRKKEKIEPLLNIINKSIPYHIVFILVFEEYRMISVSEKHPHPVNEDNAVIDWTFDSNWIIDSKFNYTLNLKESIDSVFSDICMQVSGNRDKELSLSQLIEKEQKIKRLQTEIAKLESAIKKSKQFNEKVELNMKLQDLNQRLKET